MPVLVEFVDYTLYFFLYCFLGWVMEMLHSRIAGAESTTKNFLRGPLSPLYGAGAMIILLTASFLNGIVEFSPRERLIISAILSAVFVTMLEYFTALFHEKAFGIKLWDYSGEAFNLHGRISLIYSLLWGGLAVILLTVVHPFIKHALGQLSFGVKTAFALTLSTYLAADILYSVRKHTSK